MLRASLEAANRRLASVGEGAGEDDGAPFDSDIEPIANNSVETDDGVFLRIAEDLENDGGEGDDDDGRGSGAPAVSLADPALERELEGYRAALVESLRQESADAALASAPSSDSNASERQKVNVKLLNAEDYVTDWTESVSDPPALCV